MRHDDNNHDSSVVVEELEIAIKRRLNKHWHNHPYKFKAAWYLTNQETTAKQMSTSVQIRHEDLVDVEVQ